MTDLESTEHRGGLARVLAIAAYGPGPADDHNSNVRPGTAVDVKDVCRARAEVTANPPRGGSE